VAGFIDDLGIFGQVVFGKHLAVDEAGRSLRVIATEAQLVDISCAKKLPSERREYFGVVLALRNANSDFGSTYLGMALPPKPVFIKTLDVTGPHRTVQNKKPRNHMDLRGFPDFFGLLRT